MAHPKHPSSPSARPLELFLPGASNVIDGAKSFLTASMNRIELMKLLSAYQHEPLGSTKAARDLSDQEAFDLLMHLVYRGEMFLDELVKANAAGKIISPRPGRQLNVRTYMAGIDYYRASKKGFVGNYHQTSFKPTPNFAIVLYRLAKRLGQGYYGATRIVWGGIGQGGEGKLRNCHEIGTCVDFYGAYTRHGNFDVLADWGRMPVYLKDDIKRPGGWTDDKWGNASQTTYRLRERDPGLGYRFFAEVYSFAREQCTIGSLDVPELSEGARMQAGTIIHPDYPIANLRQSHQEHMHFQLGAAFVAA